MPREYRIFITYNQPNVKIFIKETESKYKYIGENCITTNSYYEKCIGSGNRKYPEER